MGLESKRARFHSAPSMQLPPAPPRSFRGRSHKRVTRVFDALRAEPRSQNDTTILRCLALDSGLGPSGRPGMTVPYCSSLTFAFLITSCQVLISALKNAAV